MWSSRSFLMRKRRGNWSADDFFWSSSSTTSTPCCVSAKLMGFNGRKRVPKTAQFKTKPVMIRSCTNHYKSNPITGLDRPWRFQEVEAPRFQENWDMKVVRLSVLHTRNHYKRNTKSSAWRRAIRHLMAVCTQCGRSGYHTVSKWKICWRYG